MPGTRLSDYSPEEILVLGSSWNDPISYGGFSSPVDSGGTYTAGTGYDMGAGGGAGPDLSQTPTGATASPTEPSDMEWGDTGQVDEYGGPIYGWIPKTPTPAPIPVPTETPRTAEQIAQDLPKIATDAGFSANSALRFDPTANVYVWDPDALKRSITNTQTEIADAGGLRTVSLSDIIRSLGETASSVLGNVPSAAINLALNAIPGGDLIRSLGSAFGINPGAFLTKEGAGILSNIFNSNAINQETRDALRNIYPNIDTQPFDFQTSFGNAIAGTEYLFDPFASSGVDTYGNYQDYGYGGMTNAQLAELLGYGVQAPDLEEFITTAKRIGLEEPSQLNINIDEIIAEAKRKRLEEPSQLAIDEIIAEAKRKKPGETTQEVIPETTSKPVITVNETGVTDKETATDTNRMEDSIRDFLDRIKQTNTINTDYGTAYPTSGTSSAFDRPAIFGGTLPESTLGDISPRDVNIDWERYGFGPEASFFMNVPERNKMATGGRSSFAVNGKGTGRSDEIPARLSDGEYVIDAETVALLGDGSSKAGADRLDQFRVNIRKHKGKNLARGKFSVNAKRPESYMAGGRK